MMKHSIQSIKILVVLFSIMAFASCKKEDVAYTPVSAISFVNASASSPTLDVFVGQSKVQTANNDIFAFGKHFNYLNVFAGEREISFYEGTEKKITGKVTLVDGKLYSLFLAGKWPQSEIVLLEDKLSVPLNGKANIRFVNMAQDAGALDLGLENGTTLISNKAYKIGSDYMTVDINAPFNFVIRNNGSTTVLASIPAVTFLNGASYTIWAKGLKAASGTDALSIAVIRNY